MPWKVQIVKDERIRFVVEANRGETSMSSLCREFGVSRPTGYRWMNRYRQLDRIADLEELSRRPRHSPRQTSDAIGDRVVSLRLAYGWGARKLQVLLYAEGIRVSESTINRILKRYGLQYEPEIVGQAISRFERGAANELWQMDFKGLSAAIIGRCCPLSILDDHSRYAVGLHALADQRANSVHQALVQTFERYGVPQAMLVDHGTPWYSPNGHGLTWLGVALIKQGVQLCFSGTRHPQTQGKVERFHRTLGERLRHRGYPHQLLDWQQTFDGFVDEYNHVRPHEALQMAVPASRYQPSTRSYQTQPREWEYASGAIVKRLNRAGLLAWHSRYYFVSEALAGEYVEINHTRNHLLIRYRHMWIRDIDLTTGLSETLVDKSTNPYV